MSSPFTARLQADTIERMSQLRSKTHANAVQAAPFMKWAGGKSSLLAQFEPHFPPPGSYRRYFEPFLGGGAVFFSLQPAESFLFDQNAPLIEVYQVVRDHVDELIEALRPHHNDKDYFYAVRAQDPRTLTPVERAARLIFLNKTCFNGLFRVNRQGQFNVPFGRYTNPTICDEPGLRAASAALRHAQIAVSDFEAAVQSAEEGDLIYFDPPYEPLSPTSNFTGYTRDGFSSDEQRRLARVFAALSERGCRVMLSNSSAPLIYDLYRGYSIHEIRARRQINSRADGRGEIIELLVTNFAPS